MEEQALQAQPRAVFGKKVRALRHQGITPIHIYGHGEESLSLQVDAMEMVHTLARVGFTTPLTVRVDGDEHFVMVRDIQRHPASDRLLHVDLLRVSRTEKMQAAIPVHLEGEAAGARGEGTMVLQDLYEIEVEALPMDLPHEIVVDISVMTEPDSEILVKDIVLPSAVTVITDLDASLVRIVHQRAEVEEEEAIEGEEAAEAGEEAAAEGGEESSEDEE